MPLTLYLSLLAMVIALGGLTAAVLAAQPSALALPAGLLAAGLAAGAARAGRRR